MEAKIRDETKRGKMREEVVKKGSEETERERGREGVSGDEKRREK